MVNTSNEIIISTLSVTIHIPETYINKKKC